MEAKKNNRAVVVGIFIAIGIIIFMVGVFTLGGQQKTFGKSVKITAVFDDVQGLHQGNNIWFSGVKIGTVKKIEIVNNSEVKVTLQIDDKAREFIRSDAKAKIGTDGLIGNKIIVIYGGTPGAPSIEGGETIAVERALSTDDMMATLQENNVNLIDITRNFKEISKKLAAGEGTLGSLLIENFIYDELKTTITNLTRATRNSEKLTANVAAYTSQLQQPGTLAGDLITDTTLIPQLRAASVQLNDASASAALLVENVKAVTEQLKDTGNVVSVLLNDPQVAANLRVIADNLNSSSKKLDENLEALQHNFLLRGFFRKKAKQEAKAQKDSIKAAQNAGR